jgi:hypothetical protein
MAWREHGNNFKAMPSGLFTTKMENNYALESYRLKGRTHAYAHCEMAC